MEKLLQAVVGNFKLGKSKMCLLLTSMGECCVDVQDITCGDNYDVK